MNRYMIEMKIDKDYLINIRRRLHQYPETGFDLPKTLEFVRNELDKIGVEYTEEMGESSIVATVNPHIKTRTIALRADMDALPIEEDTGLEYSSKISGKMHACGHDAHTAILLGTAKELFRLSDSINCCVKLIFQSSEEGPESGAQRLVEDGVMTGVDLIAALHVDGWHQVGKVGICRGNSMASQRSFCIEFFGKTAHATLPQTGCDALAAAVRAYTGIHQMQTRLVDPFKPFICSVGMLNAGHTQNVVPDYAKMLGTIRTFDMDLDKLLIKEIEKIAKSSAAEYGVEAKVSSLLNMYNLYNDPSLCDKFEATAEKLVGRENIVEISPKLSSEDFSQYLTQCKGIMFRLGTRNEEKGIVTLPHNSDFNIDEAALELGAKLFVQLVIDNQ